MSGYPARHVQVAPTIVVMRDSLGYTHAMDVATQTQYDEGIAYEALQEVLTQTIAYYSHAILTKDNDQTEKIDRIISRLVNYKQTITPDGDGSYNEVLSYLLELREEWHF